MADKGAGVFSGIVDKVSFLTQLPLLSRATADDDEPIPGYWLEEIKVGCEPHSVQLADFLTATLNHRSGRVKLKALRLMEFMSQHDIPFRVAVSRDEGCLKEAMKWLAPVGSSLQEAVRTKAAVLLETLHDPSWTPVSARQSMPGLGTSIGNAAGSQGKMQGFGRSKHREESAAEKVRGLLDSLFGPSESQSERSMREAFTSDKGQYQRITIDQSQPIVRAFDQSQRALRPTDQSQITVKPSDQSKGRVRATAFGREAETEEMERFCSERRWPVSRQDLQKATRFSDLESTIATLSAILNRGGGAEIRALLLVEVLLRRGVATNRLRALISGLTEREDQVVATKARKVMMIMEAMDRNIEAR